MRNKLVVKEDPRNSSSCLVLSHSLLESGLSIGEAEQVELIKRVSGILERRD